MEQEEERTLYKIKGMISDLRVHPRTARPTTDVRIRSFIRFMDMEQTAVLASLPNQRRWQWDQDRIRLQQSLDILESAIQAFLERYEDERPYLPRHAALLHRAATCFRTRTDTVDYRILYRVDLNYAFLNQPQYQLVDGSLPRTYHDLGYELKVLLLYMVKIFPQGFSFDKSRVTWRYAAEGLAGTDRDRVGIAEGFFSELVSKGVIDQQAANYEHRPAEDRACRWQINKDFLRLLEQESAEKGFVCTSGMLKLKSASSSDNTQIIKIIRWLSLHQPDPDLPERLERMDLCHTRSLAISGAVDRIPLSKFVYVRVLGLEGWKNLQDEDLTCICTNMLLLRYLSVSNTGVTRLPPEIRELHLLEALDVSHTKISDLPPEIKEVEMLEALNLSHTHIVVFPPDINGLHRLKELDISHTQISEFPSKLKLRLCRIDLRSTQIRQLPEGMTVDRSMEILLVGDDEGIATKIPEGILRISLRTLATLDLSECSLSFIEAIGYLVYLKVLAITWSFHQSGDGKYREALHASIQNCGVLKSLTIHCELGCSMEFLGSLSRLHLLERFKVTAGRFVRVPKWIRGRKYLSFLQITVCKLVLVDDLEILAELPELQCLVLGLDFIPEQEIVIKSEGPWFRKLRAFTMDCPAPWLTFNEGAMPELTYLELEISSGPPNVPSGITNLANLSDLVLRYSKWCSDCSNVKKTVQAVKKQVAKHHGTIKLVINGTEDAVDQPVDDEAPPESKTPRETQGKAMAPTEGKERPAESKVQSEASGEIVEL